ncbi:MAG: Ig-like domain-containing protein, partial [Pseudomonadota bacterium]
YAFDTGSGNTIIGFQGSGSDFTPGALTAQITNNSGGTAASVNVSYQIWVFNDQARGNSLNFEYSLDDTSYTPVPDLDYTTPEASDALGWVSIDRSTTIPGLALADGATLFLRWTSDDVSGGGSRDEFGIDNLFVEVGAPPAPSLNELGISDVGTDAEFFEVAGAPSADLTDLDLVVLEGALGNNPGAIAVHIDLTGTIPVDGFWAATSPEADATYSVTGDQAIANDTFANRSRTYLLVSGFSGAISDDLDTNDDGMLDATPWTEILDDIALIDDDAPLVYSATVVGPDGTFLPPGAFRCPDGSGAWDFLNFNPENGTPGVDNGCPDPNVPAVTSTDPADGATDVAVTTTLTIDFSEAVDASATAATLDCGAGALSFSGLPIAGLTQLVLTPDADLPEGASCTATLLAAEVTDSDSNPLAADFSWTFDTAQPILTLSIEEIQGDDLRSPFAPPSGNDPGQVVRTEGNIVTSVGSNFFTMQQPDLLPPRGLGNPRSRGLFVFTLNPPTVAVGDEVTVQGAVFEFFSLTQIGLPDTVEITSSANPLPAPVVFDDLTPSEDPNTPSCGVNNFECYESMRVSVPNGFVTGPSQFRVSDPVGEAYVSAGGSRVLRGTGVEFPGLDPMLCPNCPIWSGAPEQFELDPDRINLANVTLAGGTTFSATGVIGFEFGGYELWPTELTINSTPNLPEPAPVGSNPVDLTIGSLNALNLFDDVDDPERPIATCGAGYIADDREVLTPAEYQLKLNKLADTIIQGMGAPDVIALQEVESVATLQALADIISNQRGGPAYTPYLIKGNDRGDINNGFLVNESRVTVDAVFLEGQDECLSSDNTPLHDRPVLTLEGRFIFDGPTETTEWPFVLMNSHLRSLSGIDDESRVRLKRHEQAQSVAAKVQARQDADVNLPVIVIGDLNAFEFTDGYVDVVGLISGTAVADQNLVNIENAMMPGFDPSNQVSPALFNAIDTLQAGERYSFTFLENNNNRGVSQALDHALLNRAANRYFSDFGFARGNADYWLGFADDEMSIARSSDHDGLVLVLDTDADPDPLFRDRFEELP